MLRDKAAMVISLAGEITWQNAQSIRDRLSLFAQQGHTSIVLNMEAVTYIDTTGLAMLVFLGRRLSSRNGNILLINVNKAVMQAISRAQLDDKLPAIPKGTAGVRSIGVPKGESPLRVHTVSLSRDPSSMEQARKSVSEILKALSLPRSLTYDLVLAMGEALGNAFDHGKGSEGEEGDVSATVAVYSDRIVMEVNDCGEGMRFVEGDKLPDVTDERGRGIRLMLMLADSISIEPRESGRGTCVRMVKLLGREALETV